MQLNVKRVQIGASRAEKQKTEAVTRAPRGQTENGMHPTNTRSILSWKLEPCQGKCRGEDKKKN
jgi:hypothetical protein